MYTNRNSSLCVCDTSARSNADADSATDGHHRAANRHSNPDGYRDSDGHSRVADCCASADANTHTSAKTYVDSDHYAGHYICRAINYHIAAEGMGGFQ